MSNITMQQVETLRAIWKAVSPQVRTDIEECVSILKGEESEMSTYQVFKLIKHLHEYGTEFMAENNIDVNPVLPLLNMVWETQVAKEKANA